MPLLTLTLDTFLVTTLLVAVPSVYILSRPHPPNASPRPSLRTPLSLLLLAHTIFILHGLFVDYPPNIFSRLGLPLTAPVEHIRAALLYAARKPPTASLPPRLSTLLTRLASFDARIIYVRFGHRTVESCTHCRTGDDYALAFIPSALLSYVRTITLAGFLTIRGSARERWRTPAVGALAAAAVAEVYLLLTARIDVPRDGAGVIWWHDYAWTLRHLLFLALPAVVHFLPATPPPAPPPVAQLPPLLQSLDTSLARMHLLKLSHGAIMREPALRARAERWWDREAAEGAAVREDENVQRVAEKVGLGFAEENGELRKGVRGFVEGLMGGFRAE